MSKLFICLIAEERIELICRILNQSNLFGESWSNKAKVFGFHKKRGRERKTNRYGEYKKYKKDFEDI
jgi:hypothetical protein